MRARPPGALSERLLAERRHQDHRNASSLFPHRSQELHSIHSSRNLKIANYAVCRSERVRKQVRLRGGVVRDAIAHALDQTAERGAKIVIVVDYGD